MKISINLREKQRISIEIKKKSFRNGHFLKETMNSIWRKISYVPLPLRRWPGNHFSQAPGYRTPSPQFGRKNQKPGVRKNRFYSWLSTSGLETLEKQYNNSCFCPYSRLLTSSHLSNEGIMPERSAGGIQITILRFSHCLWLLE